MTYPTTPRAAGERIDVDALMRLVRQEVHARGGGPVSAESRPNLYIDAPDELARSTPRPNRIEVRESYALGDFLGFGDEDFLRNAYIGVLRRAPDTGGYEHYLAALRAGGIDRVEILGRLRYSAEGRAKAVPISGLRGSLVYRRVRRLPLIGYLAAWCNHMLRLPRLAEAVHRSEVGVRSTLDTVEGRLERTERQIAVLSARLEQAHAVSREASALSAMAAELSEAALSGRPERRSESRNLAR